jgi:UDP-N-acetylmuramoylalanine--D-glutamate ligase
MKLRGKKVVVVGLGDSGIAAALLCVAQGATVVGTDAAREDRLSAPARELAGKGVTLALGGHDRASFAGAEVVIVSPGVPPFAALDEAHAAGALVIGELELASYFVKAPIAAIGGTNGKSTTTALTHKMLEAQGQKAFIGGNFGEPLSRAALSTGRAKGGFDSLVVEVSSFQMERAPTFRPHVAALLNVTDDHLDRYSNFAAYAAAKGNMFVNQTDGDVAVVPKGDVIATREARRGDGRIVTFGPGGDVSVDVAAGAFSDRLRAETYPLSLLRLSGSHNGLNACAAIACASEMGAKAEAIRAALAAFEGLPHRTALVGTVGGVRFYDDSKGTNVGASVAALRGLVEPKVVLIAGGRDKLGSYDPLIRELAEKGRALVLIGEAAKRIAEATRGTVEVARAGSMDEAVRTAARLAREGDAVLLSPACSSFDMFRDYKDRGDQFAAAVRALGAPSDGEKGA